MHSSKFGLIATVALLLTLAVGAICGVILATYHPKTRNTARKILSYFIPLETSTFPELHPSSGLAWSKKHYPEEYSSENRTITEFTSIDDLKNERFLDIAGCAYASEFDRQFGYSKESLSRPQVRLEYLTKADAFIGKISATGLKPNFAYQIKLRGKFDDREAFERIGRVGRWRLPGVGTNYKDDAYQKFQDKASVESYILFDFLVTDEKGNAEKEFYLDSSLHVLWNTIQRRPAPTDTRPVKFSRKSSSLALYTNPHQEFTLAYPSAIFAESEQHALRQNNRPPIGQAFLPAGKYTAEVVLTEESFHGFGGDAGYWATVIATPVEFEIVDRQRFTPYWKGECPVVLTLSSNQTSTTNLNPVQQNEVSIRAVATGEAPFITFKETLSLPPNSRYFLSAEFLTAPDAPWAICVDDGNGFEHGERISFRPWGQDKWRRCEIELTGALAGKTARIGLEAQTASGEVGVRNARVHAIPEP